MRHVHYDPEAGGRVPGYTPATAYLRLVAGVLGAVALTSVFWAEFALQETRVVLLRGLIAEDVNVILSDLWNTQVTGNLAVDSVVYAVSLLTSPWVLGTLVLGAVIAAVVSRFSP